MERIYISAPIKGMEDTAEQRFKDAEAVLRSEGYDPVNPYERNKGFRDEMDAIDAGLRLLRKCDGIALCEGWRHSDGCQLEFRYAVKAGKYIVYPSMMTEKGGEQ